MEFNKIYALITVAILSTLKEVQGKMDLNRPFVSRNNNSYRSSLDYFKVKGMASLKARYHRRGTIEKTMIGQTIFDNDIKTQRILKYLNEELPAPLIPDTIEEQSSKGMLSENLNLTTNTKNREIENIKENVLELQKNFYTNEKSVKNELDPKVTKNSFRVIVNKEVLDTSYNSQNSQQNSEGNITDSVQHICIPPPLVTTPRILPTLSFFPLTPHAMKEKRFERLATTTPAGINCRRVMNSELNELGEIIDSVTVVCDPTTTTTTTTTKPTMKTTPKTTTTTPKPLVKVCRPVMNSYLNEEGVIVDSVTMVCKMESVP